MKTKQDQDLKESWINSVTMDIVSVPTKRNRTFPVLITTIAQFCKAEEAQPWPTTT